MSNSFKKALQPRAHRERSQPAKRQRLGILEKHKDYVLRARNYHSKQDRLKALRAKAAARNPDEFYFAMQSTKTKDGIHHDHRSDNKALPTDVVKVLKTQDLAYVVKSRAQNAKKMAQLKGELGHFGAAAESDRAGKKHIKFVEDSEDYAEISKAIKKTKMAEKGTAKAPSKVQRELDARQERDEKLALAEKQLVTQRNLMGNGRRKKVGTDEYGLGIYKWAPERKR